MRRLAVGAALVLLLAGCGGDPKADPSPSPSSPTTSVSPTPSPPLMPAAAKANTKAGAIAFVRYYIGLVNHAQSTGDTAVLAAVESPTCQSCQNARQGVSAHYAAGGSIEGGDWTVDQAVAVRNEAINGWTVDLKISYTRQTVSYGSSRPDKTNQAGELVMSMQLRWRGDIWKVLEWTRAD